MFGRKAAKREEYAQMVGAVAKGWERREREAAAALADAQQREAKWDRIVRDRIRRGDTGAGWDVALANRDRAQADIRQAEVALLTAKSERSNFRR